MFGSLFVFLAGKGGEGHSSYKPPTQCPKLAHNIALSSKALDLFDVPSKPCTLSNMLEYKTEDLVFDHIFHKAITRYSEKLQILSCFLHVNELFEVPSKP